MPLKVILTVALFFAAQTAPQPPANTAPAGNLENGKKIFVAYGCYQCHGYEGQGGAAGPRIAPRPIAFQAFTRVLRQPPNQMPPYTARVLSDQEAADIYTFLRSIPDPPPVQSIPLLQN